MANGSLRTILAGLSLEALKTLAADWQLWARDEQLPPASEEEDADWRVWLILGGRGAGKTRAGAEWIKAQALGLPPLGGNAVGRIALIGETIAEARNVMVEGPSGLLAVHDERDRPVFEASRNRLRWNNGAEAYIYSAESAESLRGPQFGAAWCDELAKWRNGQMAWDMLQFSLRLGERPRVVVTTTPRPVPILKALMEDEQTVTSRVSTASNASNLAPTFVAEMRRRYDGTALGRQELYGELIEDDSGQLWRRDWIAETRLQTPPALLRRVVAVDPPVTAKQTSDACGIVVAGLAADGRGVVIADRSIQGREPTQWARAAVAAFKDFEADRIVAEVNQGGDLVRTIINQIEPGVPVRNVRATLGKWLRAEPVAALYAEGRVVHAGYFDELESEMMSFGSDGRALGHSPDRLDALVWAITDLMLREDIKPAVRRL